MKINTVCTVLLLTGSLTLATSAQATEYADYTFTAGHASLQEWLMPAVPTPTNNAVNPARVELGKKLFFDPRLSGDSNMSCATCHNPLFGWSDGLPTAKGFQSKVLGRASPTVVNAAYNSLQMWDGRKKSLEDQAMGPMMSNEEMNMNIPLLMKFLQDNAVYRADFASAYPGEAISEITVAKAIASFERTVLSNDSPFDRWVKGDSKALTPQQVNGFKLFANPAKGNCAVCHSAPNFTDSGFHNVGLASFGHENPDMGRYAEKPVAAMKGAFKTPTLREISRTAPYFHDGSATTLEQVMEHYVRGGAVKTNLAPNMKALEMSAQEQADLVAFLRALNSKQQPFVLPELPL